MVLRLIEMVVPELAGEILQQLLPRAIGIGVRQVN